MNHSPQITNVVRKIMLVSDEIGAIQKKHMQGGQNANYPYFAVESVMAAVSDTMQKNNLWIIPACERIDTSDIALVYHFSFMIVDADSGEYIERPFAQSNSSGSYQYSDAAKTFTFKAAKDQTAGMIDSYAYKNFVLKLFGISTPDADTEEAKRIEKEMQEQRYKEQAAERSAAKPKHSPTFANANGDVPTTPPPATLTSTEPRTGKQNATIHALYGELYPGDDAERTKTRRLHVALMTGGEKDSSADLTEGEATQFIYALETLKLAFGYYGKPIWETGKETEVCQRLGKDSLFELSYSDLETFHHYLLNKLSEKNAHADRRF